MPQQERSYHNEKTHTLLISAATTESSCNNEDPVQPGKNTKKHLLQESLTLEVKGGAQRGSSRPPGPQESLMIKRGDRIIVAAVYNAKRAALIISQSVSKRAAVLNSTLAMSQNHLRETLKCLFPGWSPVLMP